MFSIRAVQALHGDALLLVYGSSRQPRYLLIDGGPPTVYGLYLRPLLQKLAARGGRLDLVVLSHTDDDHIAGLLDLFTELDKTHADGGQPLIGVDAMWMNSFEFDQLGIGDPAQMPLPANLAAPEAVPSAALDAAMVDAIIPLADVAQGIDLRGAVRELNVPINAGFQQDLVSVDTAPAVIELGNLRLRVVGPTQKNLDKLHKDWQTWLATHTLPAPAAAPAEKVSLDQSIPNRASIMLLAEADGKRALLTGDGRGDHLVEGLIQAGLMAEGGVLHVDVLKLPHHGSIRNANRKFFDQVQADTYLICADGTNGNPDLPTLVDLVESAHAQGREIVLAVTNQTSSLDAIQLSHPPQTYGYQIKTLRPSLGYVRA